MLLSCSRDMTIKLWDTQTGANLLTLNEGHTDWVRRLTTHPVSKLFASASKDEKIIVWNAEVVKRLASLGDKAAKEDPVCAVLSGHSHVVDTIIFAPIEAARLIQRTTDGP